MAGRIILFRRKKPKNGKKRLGVFRAVRNKKSLAVLAALLLMLVFGISLWRRLIVKNILCFEGDNPCRKSIEESLSAAYNASPTKSSSQIKALLRKNNLVKSYKVTYVFPETIKVKVDIKQAVVSLKADGGWFALLDGEGTVLDLTESANIKTIDTKGTLPNIGEKVSDNVFFAFKLYEKINKIFEIESTKIENDRINLLVKNDSILYIFPGNGDIDYLSGAFNLIVSRLNNPDKETTIEKSEIKEVDFRFRNPVIRRK